MAKTKRYSKTSLGRHQTQCKVCQHAKKTEIEDAWVGWASTDSIAVKYGVGCDSLRRHMRFFDFFAKRQRNLRAALEGFVERALETVEPTASALIQAIRTLGELNSRGELITKMETTSINDLFERMSSSELKTYAESGQLPGWFQSSVGAVQTESEK
jgi:hypothetical protein